MDKSLLSNQIKKKSIELGFSKIGITKAKIYKEDKEHIEHWIKNDFHGSMIKSMMPASYRDIIDVGSWIHESHTRHRDRNSNHAIDETWYCEYTKSINFVRGSCQWVRCPY